MALGVFGGFRKDKRGRTGLKGGALVALVTGARAMALTHQVSAASTPERLLLASEQTGTGAADVRIMTDIHELVLRLILTRQIADIAAGITPSNAVDTALPGRDRRRTVKHAIERLELMAEMVRGVLEASAPPPQPSPRKGEGAGSAWSHPPRNADSCAGGASNSQGHRHCDTFTFTNLTY